MPVQSRLQTLLTSRRAAQLACAVCRGLPPRLGVSLARFVARRIASRPDMAVVQAFRINQWVVSRGTLEGPPLTQAVEESLEHLAVAFYQLFRTLDRPDELQKLVVFTPQVEELIARSQERRRGLIVAGLHMSGFDLTAQAAAHRGLRAAGLSLPEASETIEWQHTLRRRSGMEIVPFSLANLRHSIERLARGEVILTGIDRPMRGLKYRPLFFGRPALLPTHHIYLALKADVPVMVMSVSSEPDGRYHLHASEELRLRPYSDRSQEMVCNAERVLEAAEDLISRSPRQWTVPYPVWPELAAQVV